MTTNQPDSGNAAPPPPDGDGGGCQPGTTINPTVSAQPTGQVPPGTTVQLVARADAVTVRKDCSRSVQRIGSGTWSLTFEPPGGAERDETSMLSSATTLTTTFVAESEGIYRARFQAQVGLNTAFADVPIVAGVISLAPRRLLEAG